MYDGFTSYEGNAVMWKVEHSNRSPYRDSWLNILIIQLKEFLVHNNLHMRMKGQTL